MALKFGKSVLVEIVSIIQKGLSRGVDISQQLRDLEVNVVGDNVELSEQYISRRDSDPDNF